MAVLKALKFVWKYAKVWLIVSLSVIIVFFTATMVATQNDFLSGTIDTVLGGEGRRCVSGDPDNYIYYPKTVSENEFYQFEPSRGFKLSSNVLSSRGDKQAVLAEANRLNEEIVSEGIVLLKNQPIKTGKNALPIEKEGNAKPRISVFGKNSADIVLGGSGSGGGNSKNSVSLYEGLRKSNFELNPKLVSFYESNKSGSGRDSNPAIGAKVTGLAIGETPQPYPSDIVNSYSDYSDAALIVVSRIGGEGFDLPRLQVKNYGGAPVDGSKEGGQHYLELDKNEEDLVKAVIDSKKFDRVILLVNCATSMELGFIEENTGIDAALWIGSPGGSGATAIGKVLNGSVTPSGHLVDTYVRDFTKDPTWQNFGDNLTDGGNYYLAAGSDTGYRYVEYEEGIYLGYRYYETRSFQDVYRFGSDNGWYDENVVYPFGYGLSYTKFDWTLKSVNTDKVLDKDGNNKISIEINVKNNGDYSGKDVIQLYFSAPYITNGIEKPHVVLGAVVKTDLLLPGADKDYKLELDIKDMASYDYSDANGNGFKGYELEAGTYTIYVGRNAHDCWSAEDAIKVEYSLLDDIRYPMDIYGSGSVSDNRFEEMSGYMDDKVMSRGSFSSTFPSTPTTAEREISDMVSENLTFKYDDVNSDYMQSFQTAVREQGKSGTPIQLYKLIGADYNSTEWDELIDYLTVDEMIDLVGKGNFKTLGIPSIGKPFTIDPDGPAGYTNFMGDPSVHDTCFYCSECLIGATFNADLAHDMGVMVGLESLVGYTNGDGRTYSGWYAPALNIHRSPFSGRNWEYYSEDPYISGLLGSNVVLGAQSKGVYTYVKHFALNDQETHRDANGLVTWADEQTFREIYLKPFEMVVKIGKTHAMMSSFNRLGTVWAGGSYSLLTEVLRKEWGFCGMVVTDYDLGNKYMPPDQAIRAGNDLILCQDYRPSTPATKDGMVDEVQVKALRLATKNILYTVANSNAMNGYGEGVVWVPTMAGWKVMLICVNCALVVLAAVWGFFAIRKAKKKLAAAEVEEEERQEEYESESGDSGAADSAQPSPEAPVQPVNETPEEGNEE